MQVKGMTAFCTFVVLALLTTPCGAASDGFRDIVVVDRTTRDKTLNDYTHLTRNAIQKSWNTPIHLASTGALKGKIAVNYCVKRDGKLDSLELVRGSGNEEMDRTLLQAIRAAAPFPSFPDYLLAKRVLIKANFIVADQPLAPVTMVQHPVKRTVNEASNTDGAKPSRKFNWGVSAGNAGAKQDDSNTPVSDIPAPPTKKYKWGLP